MQLGKLNDIHQAPYGTFWGLEDLKKWEIDKNYLL
jgi:hypothetical protein